MTTTFSNGEQKSRILIIDDDQVSLEMLQFALQPEYQVYTCARAEQGMERVKECQPDLILLDVVMPKLSGFELCRLLKTDESSRDIPVIFSTARSRVEDELQGLQLGAVDYVHKPFSIPLLKARIASQLTLKKKSDLLERLVSIDGLTEIYNRRFFDDTYEREWRRAQRQQSQLTVCLIDIDYFKQYNDHYGHAQGDQCLIKIAKTLHQQFRREGDFVARYGGEEFVCVWLGADHDASVQLAQSLCDSVLQLAIPHELSKVSEYVSISAGLACSENQQQGSADSLLAIADQRLYRAKASGRNQVSTKD